MDGVLVDSASVVRRVWHRWCERQGLDAGRVLRTAHGRRTSDTLRVVAPDLDHAAELQWLEAAELADSDGLESIDGAAELLRLLPHGTWAVVTSAGRELALRRLRWAGLPTPPCLIPADEIAEGKPSPEGYLRAAHELGITPTACVVIEDAPAGVEAARAAAMRVVGLTTTHDAQALPDVVCTLPNLLGVTVRLGDTGLILRVPS